MIQYRVTKYNPNFRTEDGAYERLDWTSVFDIDKRFDGNVLSVEDYLHVEDRYVAAIQKAAVLTGASEFSVADFECTGDPYDLPDGIGEDTIRMLKELASQQLEKLSLTVACVFARLALREVVWGRLASLGGLYVHFGYDFYMYVGHPGDHLRDYAVSDLFVEDFRSPYGPHPANRR